MMQNKCFIYVDALQLLRAKALLMKELPIRKERIRENPSASSK